MNNTFCMPSSELSVISEMAKMPITNAMVQADFIDGENVLVFSCKELNGKRIVYKLTNEEIEYETSELWMSFINEIVKELTSDRA